ncbi:hypothetical protein H6F93_04015 [Leptolyngbya sp. FACHB-671]|nr:hypothetical protein [Leptolyngbya sp. FACHB-671]
MPRNLSPVYGSFERLICNIQLIAAMRYSMQQSVERSQQRIKPLQLSIKAISGKEITV